MKSVAVITGWGGCLPPREISNEFLSRSLDTSPDWITSRTGISFRRRAEADISTSDLAVGAGLAALESSGVLRADLVLLATTTPDRRCPATAPEVAWRLGLGEIPALDVSAVCSGFVYGLALASSLIRSGSCRRILLVGAETYSRIIDPGDRDTAVIFGDGAGAVVIRDGDPDEAGALLATDLGSDGSGGELICIPDGGSRRPWDPTDPGQKQYFKMQGKKVYSLAIRHLVESSQRVMARSCWAADDVEAFVGHQANQRILDAVAERIGIVSSNCFGNIAHVGNTAAASIPLALADIASRRQVAAGSRTLLSAFGGGLTWGSATLTWPSALAVHRLPARAGSRP